MANGIWQEFLKQKDYKNNIIRESVLEKVVVFEEEHKIVLTVRLKKVLPYNEFNKFIDDIKLFFQMDSFKNFWIDFLYDDPTLAKNYKDYYEKIIKRLQKESQSAVELLNYDYHYEGENGDGIFKIVVDKDSKSIKKRYFSKIKEAFKTYGFDIKMELVIDESKESVKEILKKTNKATTEKALKEVSFKEQEQGTKEFRKIKYKKYKNYRNVSISEIPATQYEIDKYINENGEPKFIIKGRIEEIEFRELRDKSHLLIALIVDKDDAICVKQFLNDKGKIDPKSVFNEGEIIEVQGKAVYDTYQKDVVVMSDRISLVSDNIFEGRKDNSVQKRVELLCHTKMTNLDGIAAPEEYIKLAKSFGHKAVGFTDLNALYAYPEISKFAKSENMKAIYGLEVNFIDEEDFIVISSKDNFDFFEKDYVVFDFETTGFSKTYDEIIEIGAVKISNGLKVDEFNHFIKPEQKVRKEIFKLTGISERDLKNAKTLSEVFPKFLDFIKGSVLIAHNAIFDIGFIMAALDKLNIKKRTLPFIDTLNLSRVIYDEKLKKFNLKALCNFLNVELNDHHRAISDAKATADCFLAMIKDLKEKNIQDFKSLKGYINSGNYAYKYLIPSKIRLLAKNEKGIKDIYRLISYALTDYFYKEAKLPKSVLNRFRENILVGGGAWDGPVFSEAYEGLDSNLEEIIKYYDFVEISPNDCYYHLIERDYPNGKERIMDAKKRILKYANKNKVIPIATSDPYYLNEEDFIYRDIYIRAPRVGGGLHPLRSFSKKPKNYFMSTDELLEKLLEELSLDEARKIVITNTNMINDQIENIDPFNKTLYSLADNVFSETLQIPSIEDEMRKIISDKIKQLYGDSPHPIIKERVSDELKMIIKNNYAPIYYISRLLVLKSHKDEYVVGSRGSVGSSFIAKLLDITEVNPLAPHYHCENGCFQLFQGTKEEDLNKDDKLPKMKKLLEKVNKVGSGIDLKHEKCPYCGGVLKGDGNNIPFETFLGFTGEKIPDIDLNFSGDYQGVAHNYVMKLLGEERTFRAGTIQKVAEKTAYGYVLGYVEDENLTFRKAKIGLLSKKVEGVQRSTGQHAGGIVVVPKGVNVLDITPLQYPADKKSNKKTTHFDYEAIERNLLKLDILGHDDPTIMKYFMDYVKKHPDEFPFKTESEIPLSDSKVLSLFSSTKALNLKEKLDTKVGTFGVPEFGTVFVRQMLFDIKPKTFDEVVKVSGLSHGTDIWINNGKDLMEKSKNKSETFNKIICCRDDILVDLLGKYNMEPKISFDITEFIRKGKPKKFPKKWIEYEKILRENGVPKWYIESAQKIEYLFPKAHAAAYVISGIRIAWFKVYKPLLFYSIHFTVKPKQYDHNVMVGGYNAITNTLNEIKDKMERRKATPKDDELKKTLEVAQEMLARGYKFLPVNAEKSHATEFLMEDGNLRMPFITISGLGISAANEIVEERNKKPYESKEDFKKRSGANKTVYEKLLKIGAIDMYPDKTPNKRRNLFNI